MDNDGVKPVALVTGAGGGIGFAICEALAGRCKALVLVDLKREAAQSTAQALQRAHGVKAIPVVADVSKPGDVEAAIAAARQACGGVDILVNNAGIGPTQLEAAPGTKSLRFWESDPDVWRRTIDINVCGTFLMARAVVPSMLEKGWGRIVNISTSLTTMQRPSTSPYGVSKAAIDLETMIWSKDLAGTGVTVNTLLPGGAVDTDFVSDFTRRAANAGKLELLKPEVMAAPVAWLASREADGVTGYRIVANRWADALNAPARLAAAMEKFVL